MNKSIVILGLFLTACFPNPAPPDSSTQPTAYIAPSYPTLQAVPEARVQIVNGIEIRMDRAWRDGKEVHAETCFTLPDNSDWSIWNASLYYHGGFTFDFGSTLLNLQESVEGQSGVRCDDLFFLNVPPDADLSTAIITVESMGAPPRAEDYCSILMPKIQQALDERGGGIQLDCLDSGGGETMQIVGKPDSMSQEEAERIVFSDEFFVVKGPWSFVFNLGQ